MGGAADVDFLDVIGALGVDVQASCLCLGALELLDVEAAAKQLRVCLLLPAGLVPGVVRLEKLALGYLGRLDRHLGSDRLFGGSDWLGGLLGLRRSRWLQAGLGAVVRRSF